MFTPALNCASGDRNFVAIHGKVIAFFASEVTPESRQLRTAINQALSR